MGQLPVPAHLCSFVITGVSYGIVCVLNEAASRNLSISVCVLPVVIICATDSAHSYVGSSVAVPTKELINIQR